MVLLQAIGAQTVTLAIGIPASRRRVAPPRRCGICSLANFAPPLRLTSGSSTSFHIGIQRDAIRCEARKQEEEVEVEVGETAMVSEDVQDNPLQGWPKVALYLFGFGALLGPPLDGIHSRVQLQIYDKGAIDIAGLHTNIWVFPLLGLFYSVVGVLQLVLDKYLARKNNVPSADLKKVVLCFIEVNWLVFENTWWGFGLAAVGTLCPLIELPINKLFGLWHYPRGNVEIFGESLVTWVLVVYFIYTPFISNLARFLSSVTRTRSPRKRLD